MAFKSVMDETGRWKDNAFVERLWQSLKYEEVYLLCLRDCGAEYEGVACYLMFCNQQRPNRALEGLPTRRTAAQSATRETPLTNDKILFNQPEPPLTVCPRKSWGGGRARYLLAHCAWSI